MTIPFRIKKLTPTAKIPTQENLGDLWDLYADGFSIMNLKDFKDDDKDGGACASKTSIQALNNNQFIAEMTDEDDNISYVEELHMFNVFAHEERNDNEDLTGFTIRPQGRILVKTGIAIELPVNLSYGWNFFSDDGYLGEGSHMILDYAVADIRPRSGLALKHGITVLNTPGTIDNSYRKEIGVILINHGHEPYTINKGDKIAQMLIRSLAPSKMEIVESVEDTGRGGFGSTGK
jgi:dUTPase